MAEVQSVGLRLVLEHINSPGEAPSGMFDEASVLKGAGLKNVIAKQRIRLAMAAADQALTFNAAALVMIWSHDNAFQVRLFVGETISGSLRCFLMESSIETTGALVTSVLLTGNGVTDSDLEVWIVEKL